MSTTTTSLAVSEKYSAFFTGGHVELSSDGSKIICQCGREIKIVSLKTGRVLSSIGETEDEDISRFIVSKDDEFLILATQNQLFRQWSLKDYTLVKTWRSVHTAPVTSLAFDPTVTLLASGGADTTIKIWDIIRGYVTHNFKGHKGVVKVTAFHPDPERLQLVSAAEDYTVKVWDLKKSVCMITSQCHVSLVTSLAFADDGDTMYSSGNDKVVCVWKTDKWKVFKTIPVFEYVTSVIIPSEFPSLIEDSDDVPRFITVASNGEVRVINATNGAREYSNSCRLSDSDGEKNKDEYITQAVAVTSTNGIAITTYDQNIVVLDKEFTQEKQLCGQLDEILSCKFLGEGDSHIAVASNTELLKVFKKDSWECQLLQGHSDVITSLDVKDNFIVSSSKDSTIRVWQLCDSTGFIACIGKGEGHTQAVQAVAMARLGSRPSFVVSGGSDLTLKLWGFPSESDLTPVTTLRVSATEHAHDKDINCISVAPNDRILATGSADKTAKLWMVGNSNQSMRLLAVLRGHRRGIWDMKFSPVDQLVATASGDGFIKLWSISDYSCVRTLEGHDSSVLSISFFNQGRQIYSSGSDGLLKLWLVKTSECLKTLDNHELKVWTSAITAKEDLFLSGGADSTLILWKDVTEEEEIEKQEGLQKKILQEQVMSNLLADKKYIRALGLAISLNRPFNALNVLREVIKQEDGDAQLEKLIQKMRMDQIGSLLKFAVEWNTNSRNFYPAQVLLNQVLKHYLPVDLIKLPGMQTVLEGLIVYTERHLQRLDGLLIDSHFAEYCHSCMKKTVPEL